MAGSAEALSLSTVTHPKDTLNPHQAGAHYGWESNQGVIELYREANSDRLLASRTLAPVAQLADLYW